MKSSKKVTRALAVALSATLAVGALAGFAGCGKKSRALVVMSEELDGLFNPFYSTTGADMSVVGETQLSMLTTSSEGTPAFGDGEAVVTKDYQLVTNPEGTLSTYYFVLKNGIKFSDGVPLTMNDVLFNMYVYLDPAYTGSTTMYSTDIVGLRDYRTQKRSGDSTVNAEDALTSAANGRAQNRLNELINLFKTVGAQSSSGSVTYDADEATMRAAIETASISDGYRKAIAKGGEITDAEARAQLRADYDKALETFRNELNSDFNAAKDSYSGEPYTNQPGKDKTNDTDVVFDEVTSFMTMEGYVTIEYFKDPVTNAEDKNHIVKISKDYNTNTVTSRESAINYVYNDKVSSSLDGILSYWATASTLRTDYIAQAKDIILHENLTEGSLVVPNITGIRSLGHIPASEEAVPESITVNGHEYKIAKTHNDDGTPVNENEYDVLRIQVNKVDPKAVWNFGFTVAPYHYYSDPSNAAYAIDIANNKFGVEWASFKFMTDVIQGTRDGLNRNKVPLGAGPYVATDRKGNDNPDGNSFYSDNIVYYKANESFLMGAPYIKQMRYQVVSSSNALNQLESGKVHFVEPQFTQENSERIDSLAKKGIAKAETWQLGYGYIGINAGKVPNIHLRRAIMAAMQTSRALEYYQAGTVANISWPMSLVSWAYPRTAGNSFDPQNPLLYKEDNNEKDYTMFTTREAAETRIKSLMAQAHVEAGNSALKIRFTIAGSNLTEHPCYQVFKQAAEILNGCGWNIEVLPDTNALTKLSTGSLSVWAAAWGSTIDPDMYQVYHKNSTATSVYAWGYREILASPSSYPEETDILNRLSTLIDEGRTTNDQTARAATYKSAMGLVLDLAVELPVYQRKTLYAYNSNVIDSSTLPETINSYTSPLGRIWEVKLK